MRGYFGIGIEGVSKPMNLGSLLRTAHAFNASFVFTIGALSVGLAQGALDEAVRYAQERTAFGQPIAEFQALRWFFADMKTELDAARLLVYRAATLADAGKPYSREASIAKLFASEAATRACNKAIQVHGGYGYTREFPVERYLRDAKLCEIGEGTSEVLRLVIARDLGLQPQV